MLSKRSLQILIVADLILITVSVVIGIAGEALLPEQLRVFEQARAEADMTTPDWVLLILGIPLIIAVLVAFIGLLATCAPSLFRHYCYRCVADTVGWAIRHIWLGPDD